MYTIDLNCDIGEGYGNYQLGNDQEIVKYITSANIACGFHAGDPATMDATVKLAIKHNVRIGAHPGLPDLNGFGRRIMHITAKEAYQLITYQVGALFGFVKVNNSNLYHVKPHGALYNLAANDQEIAEAIAQAIYDIDSDLTLFGLSHSHLTKAGEKLGLKVAHEVFADRSYQEDGTLTPRTVTGALLTNDEQAMNQVIQMIKTGTATTMQGNKISIKADTICLHGDSPNTLPFVQQLHNRFKKEEINLLTNS
ncbi:LamB/YcsF family protein [Aquibacillus rhizosphaerae]|uniref:5-oxoprolinase subunit A n=1 Tax=Aquibacillus rhizosphaerae TaxID=3051431 RepID=A0ABT7L208_9BACI|nr:5-oxoprolinase subunit PxpA [Aquibacillus sp. LR5S19]MDL4839195.1 5-oxoprolinase subunit PxpA [Aquibacillus sp. LR5S19]